MGVNPGERIGAVEGAPPPAWHVPAHAPTAASYPSPTPAPRPTPGPSPAAGPALDGLAAVVARGEEEDRRQRRRETCELPKEWFRVRRPASGGQPGPDLLTALGRVHEQTGEGGPVEWHKMGAGWSWSRRAGTEENHAADAAEGWAEIKRRLAVQRHDLYVLDEFTYPMKWGWVQVADVVATLRDRPGRQHVVITGRDAHPDLVDAADLVTDMTKVKHPMDVGRKGQRGIEW